MACSCSSFPVPLALLIAPLGGKSLRYGTIVLCVVACGTYLVEYGVISSHGAFLLRLDPSPYLRELSVGAGQPRAATLIRLPLFVALVAYLVSCNPIISNTWLPLHPGLRRRSSVKYQEYSPLVAPCMPGASAPICYRSLGYRTLGLALVQLLAARRATQALQQPVAT
jgi:hypothetical protein